MKAGTKPTWTPGDRAWRGYARHYGNDNEWFPEIRPATIESRNPDGTYRVYMEGIIPGAEGRQNPGSWVAWRLDADALYKTPEEALAVAMELARSALAKALGETT